MLGVAFECRNKLIVISAWGSNLSHSEDGKSCAVPERKLSKCALKLLMATSAAFLRWLPGGTSTVCILYSTCIIVFRDSDTSLSKMCFLGIISARRNLNIIVWYALVSSVSLRLLMGLTSIELLLISTMTMMYLFPLCKRVGNCPIWWDKTVFLTSYMLVYTSCTLRPRSVDVLGTSRGESFGLVYLTFFLDWFICPFGVSLVSGLYLTTLRSLIIGHHM